MSRLPYCIIIFVLCITTLQVVAESKMDRKLSRALSNASSDAVYPVWVYVTKTALQTTPIVLSAEAQRRRARVDPVHLLIDSLDFAVAESSIDAIRSTGCEVIGASRWLHAVAVRANFTQLETIEKLHICQSLELIQVQTSDIDPAFTQSHNDSQEQSVHRSTQLNYGPSLFQNRFVHAIKLHEAGIRGDSVRIAVFDSGFDTSLSVFDSLKVVGTYDFVNNERSVIEPDCPSDQFQLQQTYHGTLVLSTIAGYTPGELIGIAPNVEVLLAQTEITCNGTEIKREEHNWILAAEWADSAGADIITSSLGYTLFSDSGSYLFSDLDGDTPLITQVADIAASKNILVLTAVGNERNAGWGHIVTPADGDSVIAVGAVNRDSSIASFSSPGPTADGRIKPDIATLGVSVRAALISGAYGSFNGTSFSTPLVASVSALSLAHDMTLTAEELRSLIRESGNLIIPNNDVGYGLVDAVAVADIISVVIPSNISIQVGESRTITVTTYGRTTITPVLTSVNLPSGAQFVDNGDGTATLSLVGSAEDPVSIQSAIIADVGYFVDTTNFLIETYVDLQDPVSVGPNPFTDSVRVYLKPGTGLWRTISVYTISGQLVWEKVNYSPISSDVITRWQIVSWNGRNVHDETIASGVYLMIVSTERTREMIKLLKLD